MDRGSDTPPRNPRAFLLDMDGVLYHGESPLPGAAQFLQSIRHLPRVFLTNNPILPPQEVADKFSRIGLPRPRPQDILTSAEATVSWLAAEKQGFRYFAVGERGLQQALSRAGREDPENADFVVVGEGRGLDYQSLTTGINLILKKGARLVSTNPDQTVDAHIRGEHRILPGGGALVAPFVAATGLEPIIIGKPNALLYEMALQRLGMDNTDCIMVGDRPDTDIEGATRLGMWTAMVRTGRFAPDALWPDGIALANWDVDSLEALLDAIRTDFPGLFQ